MILLKNNDLRKRECKKVCKTHNGKELPNRKTQLHMFKSDALTKFYHPLKQKKIQTHKQQAENSKKYTLLINGQKTKDCRRNYSQVLSSRYKTLNRENKNRNPSVWSTESDIIKWLQSINVDIKKRSAKEYFLKERICYLNNVLVFANKKRIEMGLLPFYIDGLTEF